MKVLVVGGGLVASLHARAVHDSRQAQLCGIVDGHLATAEAVAAPLGAVAFGDLSRALDETRPDAAVVATPDSANREAAEILLGAGLDVLIDTPLATSLDDADAIVWLAQKRHVRLMAGQLARFCPDLNQVMSTVQSGELGKPVLITTSTWAPRSIGAELALTGSIIWQFAVHDVALIQWLGRGNINEVDGAQLVRSSSGLSTFAASGTLTSRVFFNLTAGWTLADTAPAQWDMKVHCEHGVVQVAGKDHEPSSTASSMGGWFATSGLLQDAARRQIDHFVRAIADRTPFPTEADDAIRTVRSTAALEETSIIRLLP